MSEAAARWRLALSAILLVAVAACSGGMNRAARVVACAPLSTRARDTVPPHLTGFALHPALLDLRRSRRVSVMVGAADTAAGVASGVQRVAVSVIGPHKTIRRGVLTRTAGSARRGTWRGAVVLPRTAPSGRWSILQVILRDGSGNTMIYGVPRPGPPDAPADLTLQVAVPTSFAVVGSATPMSVGKLKALRLSTQHVDTTGRPARVAASAVIDGPTPRSARVSIEVEPDEVVMPLHRVSAHRWQGSAEIERYQQPQRASVLVSWVYGPDVRQIGRAHV